MDVNQSFLAHNVDISPAMFTFSAAVSLLDGAPQVIPPGSILTSLVIEQGHLVSVPGKVLTVIRYRFTGNAANVGGQTARIELYRSGVAVPGTVAVVGQATTAGLKSGGATFSSPVVYGVDEVCQAVITFSAPLTAACTGIMVSVG